VFKIFDSFSGIKRVLVLPPDHKRADLYFEEKYDHFMGPFMGPFVGPAMELLMINYLARAGGVILHACSIERQGKGYLFAGQSGAGKSTLAKLWDQQKGVEVLSDDRTIVRTQEGQSGRTILDVRHPLAWRCPFRISPGRKIRTDFFSGTRPQKCPSGPPRGRCHAEVSQMLVSTLLGCPGDGIGDGNI
jgi:hypothetical protein